MGLFELNDFRFTQDHIENFVLLIFLTINDLDLNRFSKKTKIIIIKKDRAVTGKLFQDLKISSHAVSRKQLELEFFIFHSIFETFYFQRWIASSRIQKRIKPIRFHQFQIQRHRRFSFCKLKWSKVTHVQQARRSNDALKRWPMAVKIKYRNYCKDYFVTIGNASTNIDNLQIIFFTFSEKSF